MTFDKKKGNLSVKNHERGSSIVMEVGPKVIVIPNNESENPRFSMSPDRKHSLAASPIK